MTKQIKVRCPKCKTEFSYYSSEFRPFCSERCKMVDLGLWFKENYRVAATRPLDTKEQAELEQVIEEKMSDLDEDQ